MSTVGPCNHCPIGTRPVLLTAGLCSYHFQNPGKILSPPEDLETVAVKIETIAPASKKRAVENRQYTKLRAPFLAANPYCQIQLEGCTAKATDVHHAAGRIGALLLDTSKWKAACRSCHDHIETHPAEAKERGFSENRID